MNHWAVSVKKIGTQYAPVIRRVDRAEPYILKKKDGTTALLYTHEEAEREGFLHVIDLLNTEPRFMPVARPTNEAMALQLEVFGTVTSRKGKSSEVRHRRRRGRRGAHDKKEAAE